MSNFMMGAVVLGAGIYAVSLGGEWTEEELKAKKMVRSALFAISRMVADRDRFLRSSDIGDRPFDEMGANSREGERRVRRMLL